MIIQAENNCRKQINIPIPLIATLLTILLILIATANLNGQIQKGQFFLGGDLSYVPNRDQIFIHPEVGRMLSANWGLGIGIPVEYSNISKKIQPGVLVFVRRYFDLKSGFYLFLQFKTQFDFKLQNDISLTRYSFQFSPAISYFVSRRFALEASFGDLIYSKDQNGYYSYLKEYSAFELYIRRKPTVGIRYFFPVTKKNKLKSDL
jgi:hypothetical protein